MLNGNYCSAIISEIHKFFDMEVTECNVHFSSSMKVLVHCSASFPVVTCWNDHLTSRVQYDATCQCLPGLGIYMPPFLGHRSTICSSPLCPCLATPYPLIQFLTISMVRGSGEYVPLIGTWSFSWRLSTGWSVSWEVSRSSLSCLWAMHSRTYSKTIPDRRCCN